MLPSERIRELEIQIHNAQPHLDRVVVCLSAITTYLDETHQVALLPESTRVELISPTPPPLPPIPKPGENK